MATVSKGLSLAGDSIGTGLEDFMLKTRITEQYGLKVPFIKSFYTLAPGGSIMKRIIPSIVVGVPVALLTSLAFSTIASTAASSKQKMITCPFLKEGRVTFDVPAKLGSLPTQIDFDYPAKATRFSFRGGNLSLVAMDEGEPARVRIVISAQLNKKSGAYEGQIFVDMGGNQLMLHNGPVRCTIGSE